MFNNNLSKYKGFISHEESKYEESEDYDENEMEEGATPKEDLDFFKELNNYYSPFAHLVGSKIQNKIKNLNTSRVDPSYQERKMSFGAIDNNHYKMITKNDSNSRISKNKSSNYQFNLKTEEVKFNKVKSSEFKMSLKPPEINCSIQSVPIFSDI